MGFILFIISSLLKRIIQPFMFIYGQIYSLCIGEWSKYNKDLAISIDQYGNGLCQFLFNWILIKKGGYCFGNIDETISSVLGKNERDKTLTWLGKLIASILNTIQKDHCRISIDETETSVIKK